MGVSVGVSLWVGILDVMEKYYLVENSESLVSLICGCVSGCVSGCVVMGGHPGCDGEVLSGGEL